MPLGAFRLSSLSRYIPAIFTSSTQFPVEGVLFERSNQEFVDYTTLSNVPTNNKVWVVSFWWKYIGATLDFQTPFSIIYTSTADYNAPAAVNIRNTGKIQLYGHFGSGFLNIDNITPNTPFVADEWNHFVMKLNGTGSGRTQIWHNGVRIYDAAASNIANPFAWDNTLMYVLGNNRVHTVGVNGGLEQVYFYAGDIDLDANISKFYDGGYVNMGGNGSSSGLPVAHIYHQGNEQNDFVQQKGTGFIATTISSSTLSAADSTTRNPVRWIPNFDAKLSNNFSKIGTHSMLFDGSGDYYYTDDLGSYSTKPFTVEGWVYVPTTSGSNYVITLGGETSGAAYGAVMFYRNSTVMRLYGSYNGTAWDMASALSMGTVAAGNWYHLAASRDGNNLRYFFNGSLIGTITLTGKLMTGNRTALGASTQGTAVFNGNIDEFRISSISRYSNSFTPSTTAFTNDIHTDTLLHGEGFTGQTVLVDDIGNTSYGIGKVSVDVPSQYEGGTYNFSVEAINCGDTIYWTAEGTNVDANDFTAGAVSGSVSLTNSLGTFSLTSTTTQPNEGEERFFLKIRKDSVQGNTVAISPQMKIRELGASNTWDTFSSLDIFGTAVTRYTGLNYPTFAIHGVQNTDKLVFVFGVQNSARTAHNIYPACFDLTTKQLAVGSPITVGNVHPTGVPYLDCNVDGEGNIGMVSVVTFVNNANYRLFARGYTISNWGSITTSNLPTLSLSTAYQKTTDGSGHYVGYLGNNRFGISQRDAAIGDSNLMDVFTHNGANAPTTFGLTNIGGSSRSANQPQAIRAGISATNFAAYYWMGGNNANTITGDWRQGNSANHKTFLTGDTNLGSVSGNSFAASIVQDVSANVIGIHQIRNSNQDNRIIVSKWTNANTPTSNPSVTLGTYTTSYGPFPIFLPYDDKTQAKCRVPVFVSSTETRYDTININTTTLAISSIDTGVIAEHPWTGDMYWKQWYNSTYGEWIFNWHFNTSTGKINFYANKWNP